MIYKYMFIWCFEVRVVYCAWFKYEIFQLGVRASAQAPWYGGQKDCALEESSGNKRVNKWPLLKKESTHPKLPHGGLNPCVLIEYTDEGVEAAAAAAAAVRYSINGRVSQK
jgi:hypothetical protein